MLRDQPSEEAGEGAEEEKGVEEEQEQEQEQVEELPAQRQARRTRQERVVRELNAQLAAAAAPAPLLSMCSFSITVAVPDGQVQNPVERMVAAAHVAFPESTFVSATPLPVAYGYYPVQQQ